MITAANTTTPVEDLLARACAYVTHSQKIPGVAAYPCRPPRRRPAAVLLSHTEEVRPLIGRAALAPTPTASASPRPSAAQPRSISKGCGSRRSAAQASDITVSWFVGSHSPHSQHSCRDSV